MASAEDHWRYLLDELARRDAIAKAMGGEERLRRQESKGRLNARERLTALCDDETFHEYGALGGSANPAGGDPIPADGLVGGVGKIEGRSVVVLAEDFSVMGGSIGHVNSAKRLRLAEFAGQEGLPLLLLLDGAGERATNALVRYPFAPNDLQVLADLREQVPIVALILGSSAGHGALSALFADLIVMTKGASLFAAGPPLVEASLGIKTSPEELGGALMHSRQSGVVHNVVESEEDAFQLARQFLAYFPSCSGGSLSIAKLEDTGRRSLDRILQIIPPEMQRPYDMRSVLDELVDRDSLLELQPDFGESIITALGRVGGESVLFVANQPQFDAGAITAKAADKATHFLRIGGAFELPVIFLTDNPGVMPGPDAERAGTLRSAANMYAAQRALRARKIHVTIRKAFGFGSSLMGMNPFDHQTVTLAFPGISLGGVPAIGGSTAAKVSAGESEKLQDVQSGAWTAADNGSYDRVIDPRELRNELIIALRV